MAQDRVTQDLAAENCIDTDALIEEHLGLAYAYAARFKGRGVPREDLRQVAAEALIRAARQYDTGRGIPFPAYAGPTILGTLKRYFRDATWNVHVPRSVQEQSLQVHQIAEELAQKLGRSPRVSELASAMGMAVQDVIDGLEAAAAYSGVPLEFPGQEPAVGGGTDPGMEMTENVRALVPLMAQLREQFLETG